MPTLNKLAAASVEQAYAMVKLTVQYGKLKVTLTVSAIVVGSILMLLL